MYEVRTVYGTHWEKWVVFAHFSFKVGVYQYIDTYRISGQYEDSYNISWTWYNSKKPTRYTDIKWTVFAMVEPRMPANCSFLHIYFLHNKHYEKP